MLIGNYISMVHKSQQDLVKALHRVAERHPDETDIEATCQLLASWSSELENELHPFIEKYGEQENKEPDRLQHNLFSKSHPRSLALLRDLQDLWLMANEALVGGTLLRQAALGLRDEELTSLCNHIENIAKRQIAWLLNRMKTAATQILIAAE